MEVSVEVRAAYEAARLFLEKVKEDPEGGWGVEAESLAQQAFKSGQRGSEKLHRKIQYLNSMNPAEGRT